MYPCLYSVKLLDMRSDQSSYNVINLLKKYLSSLTVNFKSELHMINDDLSRILFQNDCHLRTLIVNGRYHLINANRIQHCYLIRYLKL